jgi:hypothetical protein
MNYLINGAESYNNDINAIDKEGVQFDAGQICTKDDQVMRALLALNEYNPVLEISQLTWHGTYFQYPTLTIMVSDDVSRMMLRSSFRRPAFSKRFYSKRSPLYTGKMNLGQKIKLMDYTTSIWVDRNGITHPCMFVKKMIAKPSCQKQMIG